LQSISVRFGNVFVSRDDRAGGRGRINPRGEGMAVVVGDRRVARCGRRVWRVWIGDVATSGTVNIEAGQVADVLNEALAVEARRLTNRARDERRIDAVFR